MQRTPDGAEHTGATWKEPRAGTRCVRGTAPFHQNDWDTYDMCRELGMMGIGIGDDGDLPKAVAMEVLLREINGWTTVDQGWTTVVPGLWDSLGG